MPRQLLGHKEMLASANPGMDEIFKVVILWKLFFVQKKVCHSLDSGQNQNWYLILLKTKFC